jgi:hypothetical protein
MHDGSHFPEAIQELILQMLERFQLLLSRETVFIRFPETEFHLKPPGMAGHARSLQLFRQKHQDGPALPFALHRHLLIRSPDRPGAGRPQETFDFRPQLIPRHSSRRGSAELDPFETVLDDLLPQKGIQDQEPPLPLAIARLSFEIR